MDERDWRIAQLETALRQITKLRVNTVATGVGQYAAVNQQEMLRIACKALDGGDGSDVVADPDCGC